MCTYPGEKDIQRIDVTQIRVADAGAAGGTKSLPNGPIYAHRRQWYDCIDLICSTHVDAVGKLLAYPPEVLSRVSGLSEKELNMSFRFQ